MSLCVSLLELFTNIFPLKNQNDPTQSASLRGALGAGISIIFLFAKKENVLFSFMQVSYPISIYKKL